MVIAADRKQSRVVMRYAKALLSIPILKNKVLVEKADAIELDNRTVIEVHTASFRSTKGYASIAILADEVAVWPTDDAAEPDYEILNALRPSMAQFEDAILLCASSPYAQKGSLFDAHKQHFANDGDPILVWQAPTRRMNPKISQRWIDREYEKDPASAAAEYGAQFRSDIAAFIAREVVNAAVVPGRFELSPQPRCSYAAFCDPAGGSGLDAMTIAVTHREGDTVVLDAVREFRPPFSPEFAVDQMSHLLKSYNVRKVRGDAFAGEWPRERFRKCGISYEVSDLHKSDIYRDLLPVLNSRHVELLDNPRLIAQLSSLERRTARGGRDSIDHPRGAHDDMANAVAGAIVALTSKSHRLTKFGPIVANLKAGFVPSRNHRPGQADSRLKEGTDLYARAAQHGGRP